MRWRWWFFDTYYRPNHATLTVTGDFDPAQARELIQEYFADIPSGPAPPPVECTQPFPHLPVRDTVRDANANLPAFMAAYGMPQAGHADSYALSLLSTLLLDGESSRLFQRLVKQERAAVAVQPAFQSRRGPGVFALLAIANQGTDAGRLETLIDQELERVRSGGVTVQELEKAKNRTRAQAIRSRQTALGRAEALQYFAHFHGDPAAIRTDMERYLAVTREEIQRVANQYLVPNNRAVVITQPAAAAQD